MQKSDLRRRKRKDSGEKVDVVMKYKELAKHYEMLKTKYEEQTKLVLKLKNCPSCPACGRKFDSQKNLDKHFYKNHPDLKDEYNKVRGYINDKNGNIISDIAQQLRKVNSNESNRINQSDENNGMSKIHRQRARRGNDCSTISIIQEHSVLEGKNENEEKKIQEAVPKVISRVDYQPKSDFAKKQSENDLYVPEIEIVTKGDIPQPERLLLKDKTPKLSEPEIKVVPYNPPQVEAAPPPIPAAPPPSVKAKKTVRGEILTLKRQVKESSQKPEVKENKTETTVSETSEPVKSNCNKSEVSNKSIIASQMELFDEDEMFDNLTEIAFYQNGAFNDDDFVGDDDAPPL